MLEILFSFAGFVFGCLFGSFANVLILRIPKKEVWWKGRSYCPSCKKNLKAHHLVPILSFLFLGKKCAYCKKPISWRYSIIELSMGLLSLGLTMIYSWDNPAFYFYFLLIFLLLIIAIIDFETMYIFDRMTYPWTAVFFITSFFVDFISWQNSLIGFLFGFGSFYMTAWLFYLVTKKQGLGGGDIKLMGLVGAALGIKGILFTIFIGSLSGAVLGLLIRMISPAVDQETHPRAFPFGPFLCLAAIIYIYVGEQIIDWYLGFM